MHACMHARFLPREWDGCATAVVLCGLPWQQNLLAACAFDGFQLCPNDSAQVPNHAAPPSTPAERLLHVIVCSSTRRSITAEHVMVESLIIASGHVTEIIIIIITTENREHRHDVATEAPLECAAPNPRDPSAMPVNSDGQSCTRTQTRRQLL